MLPSTRIQSAILVATPALLRASFSHLDAGFRELCFLQMAALVTFIPGIGCLALGVGIFHVFRHAVNWEVEDQWMHMFFAVILFVVAPLMTLYTFYVCHLSAVTIVCGVVVCFAGALFFLSGDGTQILTLSSALRILVEVICGTAGQRKSSCGTATLTLDALLLREYGYQDFDRTTGTVRVV